MNIENETKESILQCDPEIMLDKAESILKEHIDKLHSVAGVLLEKEKIDGDEFDSIFNS